MDQIKKSRSRESIFTRSLFTRKELSGKDKTTVTFPGEELAPFYQPIIGLISGKVEGHECLGRCVSDSGGCRSLVGFFNDHNIDIDYKLEVDRAIRYQALEYFSQHSKDSWITINVSPNWIENLDEQSELPTLTMIRESGINPRRVVIELTESQCDLERLKDITALYREAGLIIAIDDFGAGASQLDRVEALKPDIIKLDLKNFKRNGGKGDRRSLASLVSGMMNHIGCQVICECVESEEDFEIGVECGSHYIQGYIFHQAAPEMLEADSTVEQARRLQQNYLKSKTVSLVKVSEYRDKIESIVHEIFQNYRDGAPHRITKQMLNAGIYRYYICDDLGRQLSPDFEITPAGFLNDESDIGLNLSHRPYFAGIIAMKNTSHGNFFVSDIYRDCKTRSMCQTFASYMDPDRILLVDTFVDD